MSKNRQQKTASKPNRQTTQNKPKKSKQNGRTSRTRIPVAYGYATSNYARLDSAPSGAILSCREIFPVIAQSSGLSYALPMTPSKWSGTRTCALSYTYASHRPLKVRVYWEPAVSTATPGSVAVGTVFAGARLPNDSDSWSSISRSLAASNGGFVCTIWDHHSTMISTGRNLRANQFPLYEVSPDDIPFWICLATSATEGMIGYLVVEAIFSLKNPLSGSMSQPITGAGSVQITHDDSANTSTMTIPQQFFNKALQIGQDFVFTAASNLKNVAGNIMTSILSPFVGQLASSSGSNYVFNVDNNFATQQALGYVVGMSSNF